MYVVLQGDYTDPALAGEVWQTGTRFATRPGGSPPPDVGALVPFDVVALNQLDTQPTYTITSNWTTEMGISDLDPVSWLKDQIRPAATALLGAAAISSSVRLRSILVYPIRSPDGKVEPAPPYAAGSPCRLDYTSSFPTGGGGSGILPPQLSVVASLRTSQVGRRGRGRMYLPPFNSGALAGGRIRATEVTAAGAAMKAWLEGCRLAGTGPGGVWVSPCVTGDPYTGAALITQVRIGNVYDTQSRRRRALAESFTNTSVDPTGP